MGDTYQINIEPGDWRPVLVGPQETTSTWVSADGANTVTPA